MALSTAALIDALAGRDVSRASELAKRFGVSERTVRERIRKANDALAPAARIVYSRSRGGYVLAIEDAPAFEAWRERALAVASADAASHASTRVSYLLNDLLQRSGYVTIDHLAATLYVSRASISADLKQVERVLSKYDLALEKRPRHGIRVRGDELSRRLCLAEGVIRRLADDEPATSLEALESELEPTIRAVSACVDEALACESFPINSFSYQNLLVHISIALMRIKAESLIPFDADQLTVVAGTREHEVAKRIAGGLNAALGIELPAGEVAYIAIHLAGKRIIEEGDSASGERGLVISDEVWHVAGRMIEQVWRGFRFDFRSDVELHMNLARHIVPLSVRLRYHLNLDNPLLADIKERYPLAYSMAADSCSVLAEAYGSLPSEAETGYIALAFALALERQKTVQPRKNILAVCASGAGTARLLSYRITQEFGEHIGSIVVRNASQVAEVDFSGIDYVFTTVPLGCEVPVPVRQITLFLDDDDRRAMRELLHGGEPGDLGRFFPHELFFPHCALATHDEVLAFLCERLRQADELPENFDELVREREELAPTAFGNLVALPHPIEAVGTRTVAAVALFDAPIAWDESGQQVQAVFLASVARVPEPDLDSFYHAAARLFNSREAVSRLVEHQDHDVLMCALRDR